MKIKKKESFTGNNLLNRATSQQTSNTQSFTSYQNIFSRKNHIFKEKMLIKRQVGRLVVNFASANFEQHLTAVCISFSLRLLRRLTGSSKVALHFTLNGTSKSHKTQRFMLWVVSRKRKKKINRQRDSGMDKHYVVNKRSILLPCSTGNLANLDILSKSAICEKSNIPL